MMEVVGLDGVECLGVLLGDFDVVESLESFKVFFLCSGVAMVSALYKSWVMLSGVPANLLCSWPPATQSMLENLVRCRTTLALRWMVPLVLPFTTHCTVWLMRPTMRVSVPAKENFRASIFLMGMSRNSASSKSIMVSVGLGSSGDRVTAKDRL